MRVRSALSGVFAVASMLVLTLFGCGGAQEEYAPVSRPLSVQPIEMRRVIDVPGATVDKMRACVERAASRLTERSYALQYDVAVNEQGNVLRVKLRDATLQDTELEGCFWQALRAMSVPAEALGLRRSGPISGGERMARERRGPLGSSESSTPLVVLGPLIIEGVGTHVLIEIGVVVLAGLASLVGDDEEDAKRECETRYVDCLMTEVADRKGDKHGRTRCRECRSACLKNKGIWPSRATRTVGTVSCEYWRR